ncbi:MFS family permease [Kitasatospora sp. MAA4]|uniref:MFS transporter n=1 Tax=Kitasatospora sp. MAA4 TaxID=3035093 RepID=UPI0024765B56|nr:MFS transporter [Kitasatospora sp. MAA4]MDH6136213.1 MFS family permease [Kitasatospora sp. MAA4]
MTADTSTAQAPVARPLRELLTHRPYWSWTLLVQLLNLPVMMAPIAFAGLAGGVAGAAKDGGVLVASLSLSNVVASGLAGRYADRTSGRRVPVLSASLIALGLAGVLAGALAHAPLPVLCVLCAVAGSGYAGLTGLTRTLLNRAVPERLVEQALAVRSTMVELLVITAPLIASAALFLFGWSGGIAVQVAAGAVLVLMLAFGRGTARPAPKAAAADSTAAAAGRERLWSPAFVAWIAVGFVFSNTLGAIETAALPLSQDLHGGAFGGGGIVALLAVSSALAGLAYAAAADRLRGGPYLRASLLVAVLGAMTVLIGQVGSWGALVAALIVAGVCTAPLNTIQSHAVEKVIPESRRAEGFGWLFSGGGTGFAVSGLALSALPLRFALALPAVGCLITIVLLTVSRPRGR